MKLKKGKIVNINLLTPPKSLSLIKKKFNNKRLSDKEINLIVKEIVNNSLSETDIAFFVAALCKSGMSFNELTSMIKAIVKNGNKLNLNQKIIVDKHSIGGVPGNRTTPIVVSICASAGLTFPKTSSRAITSAAGTADVIETVAKVDFSIQELKKIIQKTNAFMVWGGSLGLTPADSKIIKVERILRVDPRSQTLVSIMAKKISVGSTHIIIDIPYGKNAKVSKKQAEKMKKDFIKLGKYFKKKIRVVLTNGSEPIGNGIGPALELKDVIKVLNPIEKGPRDLEEKSLFLAGEIFNLTGKTKNGEGIELAKNQLYSGKAFKKFEQIIKAQNGSLKKIKGSKFKRDLFAKKSGKIKEIHNKKLVTLTRILGCPTDKFSGAYLYCHVGDNVKKGQKILTIYSETKSKLNESIKCYNENTILKIK